MWLTSSQRKMEGSFVANSRIGSPKMWWLFRLSLVLCLVAGCQHPPWPKEQHSEHSRAFVNWDSWMMWAPEPHSASHCSSWTDTSVRNKLCWVKPNGALETVHTGSEETIVITSSQLHMQWHDIVNLNLNTSHGGSNYPHKNSKCYKSRFSSFPFVWIVSC